MPKISELDSPSIAALKAKAGTTTLLTDLAGKAPIAPAFLVVGAADGTLPNERRLVAGANVTITDGGPGGTLEIAAAGGGGGGSGTAVGTSITDAGDFYTGGNVEAALQEVGSTIATQGTSLAGKAPLAPQYLVVGPNDATLPNERRLVAGANVTITDNGAGSSLVIAAALSSVAWGSITGSIATQTDLATALDAKTASATLAATSGAGLVGWQQAGTGSVASTLLAKGRERVSVADFISPADLATAVARSAEVEIATAIANAVTQLTAIGGGELYIPAGSWKISSTVVFNEPSIDVIGAGGDGNHDVASPVTGTTIRWRGADGGEMIRVQSKGLVGSATPNGGSLRNLKLSGGAVNAMSIALLVASVRGWTFENITIYDPTSHGVYVTVQPLGAEARDAQKCLFRHITIRNLAAGSINAHGFELTGDAGANTSFNIFEHCDVMHQNGAGYKLVTADNNMFTQCRAFRPSGTGYGLEVHGNNTAGFECNSNTFYGFSPSSGGIKLFGTTTYTVPSKNTLFYAYDLANGSALPTVETGASWHMHQSTGATYQDYFIKPVIGVDNSAVDAHRAARSSESLRIYNFSANHVRYVDGAANEWVVRIDGSGNFETVRMGGTGVFKVANKAEFADTIAVSSGNRVLLQGATNLTGIRYQSSNVEVHIGASFAAGFGTNTLGFCGTSPISKPTVTGAKSGNAALTSLLTQLAAMGLITDSST